MLSPYTVSQHQRELELLNRLTSAILALKLEAQEGVQAGDIAVPTAYKARYVLIELLGELEQHVETRDSPTPGSDMDAVFSGLARRYVRVNPSDVKDRVGELSRLRDRLDDESRPLRDQDYRLLDQLQAIFQAETAESTRNLYRF